MFEVRERERGIIDQNTRLRQGLAEAVEKIEKYKEEADLLRDKANTFDEKYADINTKLVRISRRISVLYLKTAARDEVVSLTDVLKEKEKLVGYLQSQLDQKALPKTTLLLHPSESTTVQSMS